MRPAAGIDRWRKGWITATVDGAHLELSAQGHIDETIVETAGCAAIAIDMPIALPVEGWREAERELRALLGSAGRSVFYSPTRAAIQAPDRASADVVNRANGGPGISAQAWGLAASVREVRAALTGNGASSRWWETHPETTFAVMNGGLALASKRSARGVAERLELLRGHYPTLEASLLTAPDKVPIDDVLDAVAAAWSAARIASATARIVGSAGRDDQGFPLGVRV